MINSSIDTAAALKYFKQADGVMHQLLTNAFKSNRSLRIPTPKKPDEHFTSLMNAIIGQQISTKAAASVRKNVTNFLGRLTPENVQNADFDELKACGLSNQKTKYLKHNAEVWHEIPYGNFVHLPNEAVITELIKLYGVGRWTAEMFLIFSLARADVFSYGDLGLMKSLLQQYNYKPHHVRKIRTTVERWSPHQTLASLALWHALDNEPAPQ